MIHPELNMDTQPPEPKKTFAEKLCTAIAIIISIALAALGARWSSPASRSSGASCSNNTSSKDRNEPEKLLRHLPRPPHRTRKEPTMSTRLYYDQYGIPTDISELEAWSE